MNAPYLIIVDVSRGWQDQIWTCVTPPDSGVLGLVIMESFSCQAQTTYEILPVSSPTLDRQMCSIPHQGEQQLQLSFCDRMTRLVIRRRPIRCRFSGWTSEPGPLWLEDCLWLFQALPVCCDWIPGSFINGFGLLGCSELALSQQSRILTCDSNAGISN